MIQRVQGVQAVLERELLRASRRWQTHALRAGVVAALLLVVAAFWADDVANRTAWDRAALSQVGRTLFSVYTWTQLLVVSILAPVLVAQGIIEEREAGTLDLLAVTRLSPVQLVWGKLLSPVLSLEAILVGGLPLLAVCLSLGGLEPLQLANALLQQNVCMLFLGACAAFLAVWARGAAAAASPALGWSVLLFGIGPSAHRLAVGDDSAWAWLSPTWALGMGHGVEILGPLLAFAPLSGAIVLAAGAGLRAQIGRPDGLVAAQGWESPDAAAFRGWGRWMGIAFMALVGTAPLVMLGLGILHGTSIPAIKRVLPALSWLWNAGGIALATALMLALARFLEILWARRQREPSRRHKAAQAARHARMGDWKSLAVAEALGEMRMEAAAQGEAGALPASAGSEELREWAVIAASPGASGPDQAAAPAPARGRGLSGRPSGTSVSRGPRRRFAWSGDVWRNPVAWREVVTRAWGGLGQRILRSYFVLLPLAFLLGAVGAFRVENGTVAFVVAVSFFTYAAWVVVATSIASVAGELRAGTLPLLVTTRLGAARVLLGKLQATLLFAAPALVVGLLLMLQGVSVLREGGGHGMLAPLDPAPRRGSLMLSWTQASVWILCTLLGLATTCHWIGLRARSAARCWAFCVIWVAALLVVPPVFLGIWGDAAAVRFAVSIVNPVLSDSFWDRPGAHAKTWLSASSWLLFSALAFASNVRRLGR